MAQDEHFDRDTIRTQAERSQHREHSVPIFPTSSFIFDSAEQARALFAGDEQGPVYSRYSNPNTDEFIEKLCKLEKTEDGIATASGMAAMYSSLVSFLRSGDHIVASRSLFGSTHQIITQLLPRWGIDHTYVAATSTEEWEQAIRPETKMIFVETPSNPGLDIVDLERLGKLAQQHDIMLNVDNCFATPYLQRPTDFGATIVTHSATKFIDGQGRVLGGAVLGSAELIEEVRFFTRHTGPAMSPFNAWILSKSLETLSVRMERHCESARQLALRLEKTKGINWVRYPFLDSHPHAELARKQMKHGGGLVTFEVAGGQTSAQRFMDALKMLSLSSNLGDTRTIATHPASTTHSKLSEEERAAVGITEGLVRISVGLEGVDEIYGDIIQALDSV